MLPGDAAPIVPTPMALRARRIARPRKSRAGPPRCRRLRGASQRRMGSASSARVAPTKTTAAGPAWAIRSQTLEIGIATALSEHCCAHLGDVLVLLRRVATHADGPDHLPIHGDRYAALKRGGAREGEGGDAPRTGLVLELLARPPEDRRRPGLPDADLDAGDLCVVKPVQQNEMASVVHDGDDDRGAALRRLGLGRGA